jgi:hypothetical protein
MVKGRKTPLQQSHRSYLGLDQSRLVDVEPVLNFGASKKVAVERFQLFLRGGMKHGHKEEFYRADEGRMLATEEWVAETITRLGEIPRGARPLQECFAAGQRRANEGGRESEW